MAVGVGSVAFHRLVPNHGLQAHFRLPVELHVGRCAILAHKTEGVNAKPLHRGEGTWDRPVRHGPHDRMHGLWRQRDKIPKVIMRRGSLGKFTVGDRFDGMDQVGKLDGVLDEKYRDVVAHQIPIALISVEFHRKAAHIAGQVRRSFGPCHSGKPHENLGLFAHSRKWRRLGHIGQRAGADECAMRPIAARMNHAFRDAFMVEMKDFLAQRKVFQQCRAGRVDTQRILVVSNYDTLRRGQSFVIAFSVLVNFTARPPLRDQIIQVG